MAKVFGASLFGDRLHRLGSEVRSGDTIMNALEVGGTLIAQHAIESIIAGAISGPGHQPSAPGEPPNADTHELDQSIHVVSDRTASKVRVTADSEAALPMEFGTSTVAERPFMRPAAVAERPRARQLIVAAVNSAVEKSRTG